MNSSDLSCLTPGCRAVVEDIRARGPLRRRLLDLGFIPGSRVSCLFSSPSGDPQAYLICGTVIALRNRDAALVLVRKLSPEKEQRRF